MLENISSIIYIVFILTTLLTVVAFYLSTPRSFMTIFIITVWLIIQSIISITDFYSKTNSIPPRFALATFPAFLLVILLFVWKPGKIFLSQLNLSRLTYLHTIRIPVELVLFWLYQEGKIPQLMTFEGKNFDILSGITAPFIGYFCFRGTQVKKTVLLIWNLICLGLLFNIVILAILSAPFPFQQFAFDQPNVAVLHFPFVWLPCCIVPLVLLSHLASIRLLLMKEKSG